MIKYNAKLVAAVALAQSNEQTRYYLCGVYFEGEHAIATDGHKLTVSHDPDAIVETSGIYPITKKAIAAMKKADIVTIDNGILQVLANEQVTYMEPCIEVDGTFPDWRKVIPKEIGNATHAAFAPEVLSVVIATAKTFEKNAPISITGTDATYPHIVTYAQPDIMTVVMPMRAETPQYVSWLAPKLEDTIAA